MRNAVIALALLGMVAMAMAEVRVPARGLAALVARHARVWRQEFALAVALSLPLPPRALTPAVPAAMCLQLSTRTPTRQCAWLCALQDAKVGGGASLIDLSAVSAPASPLSSQQRTASAFQPP
jgi:hypothetical protein